MSPPPVCENCKRVVDRTRKVGLMIDGDIEAVRELCSACKVYAADCFEQAATVDRPAAGRALMAAWDDRMAWKLFTGHCRYCGVVCRGVTCAAHADLPRLELLPVQRSVGTVDEPAGDEAA